MIDASVKRLNWGCAGHVAAGWINCDIKQSPRINLTCDIRQGLALNTGSVDYATSIHALQEIPYADLGVVLGELRRVLKPGGVLRLCLPDFDKAVQAYVRGDRTYFCVPDEDASGLGGKLIVQILWYGYSRIMFTHDFIEELLLKAGFARVVHCGYRETASVHPDIVVLDNRETESLFVEATR